MKNNIVITLFSAALMSVQFVFIPFFGSPHSAGKIFYFVIITLLFSMFILGYSKNISISIIHTCLLLFFLIGLFTLFFSVNKYNTLLFLSVFLVLTILSVLITSISYLYVNIYRTTINFLLIIGLIVALLGLYEYVSFLTMGMSQKALIPYLIPHNLSSRVIGIYGQPNLLAVFLTVTMLGFFYRYLSDASIFSKSYVLVFRFLPFFIVSFVFFSTGSRAGFLSFFLIYFFIAWLVASGRFLKHDSCAKKEFLYLTLCVCFSFITYRYSLAIFSISFDASSLRSFTNVGMSSDARFLFWMSAFLIFLDHPLVGIGLGNFSFVQNAYGPAAHEALGFVPYEAMLNTQWAHNELLQILCEGGIMGFIVILFLLGVYLL